MIKSTEINVRGKIVRIKIELKDGEIDKNKVYDALILALKNVSKKD